MRRSSRADSDNTGQGSSIAPAYHRMNFLLQTSQRYALVSGELSRNCYRQAREISRKKLARIDPDSRRYWCKRCSTYLIPGLTCELTLEDKKITIDSANTSLNGSYGNKSNGNENSNDDEPIKTNIFNVCSNCNWKRRHSYNCC